MRIALVTETFLPSTDGVVTRLTEACRFLIDEGHDLMIICPRLEGNAFEGARVHGIRTVTFPFYRSRPFALPARRVKKLLRDFRPDIVHAVNPFLLAASGVKYARQLNLPLLASYHTHIPKYLNYYKENNRLEPWVWRYIIRTHNLADLNLCTSEAMYEELAEHGMLNLHVLQRGVDTVKFHPQHSSRSMRSSLTRGHPDDSLLIYVGRLSPEKNLAALRPLLDLRPELRLALIGEGPARGDLEKLFEGTRTSFEGVLRGHELAMAYASADAFVFPSSTETLGLVILESMASGLPVVAADSEPTREQIRDGEDGLIFRPGDSGHLAEQIDRILRPEVHGNISRAARKRAENFSWTQASAELFTYYEKTIEAAGKR